MKYLIIAFFSVLLVGLVLFIIPVLARWYKDFIDGFRK